MLRYNSFQLSFKGSVVRSLWWSRTSWQWERVAQEDGNRKWWKVTKDKTQPLPICDPSALLPITFSVSLVHRIIQDSLDEGEPFYLRHLMSKPGHPPKQSQKWLPNLSRIYFFNMGQEEKGHWKNIKCLNLTETKSLHFLICSCSLSSLWIPFFSVWQVGLAPESPVLSYL